MPDDLASTGSDDLPHSGPLARLWEDEHLNMLQQLHARISGEADEAFLKLQELREDMSVEETELRESMMRLERANRQRDASATFPHFRQAALAYYDVQEVNNRIHSICLEMLQAQEERHYTKLMLVELGRFPEMWATALGFTSADHVHEYLAQFVQGRLPYPVPIDDQ